MASMTSNYTWNTIYFFSSFIYLNLLTSLLLDISKKKKCFLKSFWHFWNINIQTVCQSRTVTFLLQCSHSSRTFTQLIFFCSCPRLPRLTKPSTATTCTCSLTRTSTIQRAASTIRWLSQNCSSSAQMFFWRATGVPNFHKDGPLTASRPSSLWTPGLRLSFCSPAKIFTSKNSSSSTSSNGSPTSTTAAAKPHLRRALSGPKEATRGSTATIIPPEAPSSPNLALKMPPLLDLPSAGPKDLYKVHCNSIDVVLSHLTRMWQSICVLYLSKVYLIIWKMCWVNVLTPLKVRTGSKTNFNFWTKLTQRLAIICGCQFNNNSIIV